MDESPSVGRPSSVGRPCASTKAAAGRHRRSRGGGPGVALMSCAMAVSMAAATQAWAEPLSPLGVPTTVPGVSASSEAAGAEVYRIVRVEAVPALLPQTTIPVVLDSVPGSAPGRPDVSTALPPVRSVAVPVSGDRIQIGNLDLRRPGSVPPELASQITAGSGDIVRGVSDVLRSNGVSAARADKVAEQMVGDAVVGGVIGGAVAAPVALAVGAVVGGGLGLLFGIPFLPTGLVVGPVVGTALVAGLIAAPAVAAGTVIGAATGYQKGWTVPLDRPTPRHMAAPVSGTPAAKAVTDSPAPKAVTDSPAPKHERPTAKGPVTVVERIPAVGQGPADCSVIRMAEVALAGGALGSCGLP